MSSSTISKTQPQQVSRHADNSGIIEEKEASAKANASAGLNLNIFGAISGALSSKSNKKTEADGSSVEEREEKAAVKGAGMGSLNAQAHADAEQRGRQMRAAIQEKNAA